MSQNAGRAIGELESFFPDQVIFLEYSVDFGDNTRKGRWWSAYDGSGSVLLPLIMVDSGAQISNGPVDYLNEYKSMINAQLDREPGVEIQALVTRINSNELKFELEVTNKSGLALSQSRNDATLFLILYGEDSRLGLTSNFVLDVQKIQITPELSPEGKAKFEVGAVLPRSSSLANLNAVTFVDYLPEGNNGAYDMLQAVTINLQSLTLTPTPFNITDHLWLPLLTQ